MKQQINFYTEILRIRNIPLSFHTMKNFIYGLFLFMLVSTLILGIIQFKNEHDLRELEKKQLSTTSQLKTQASKITSRQDREQIISQLEVTEKLYEKNKKTLQALDDILQTGSEGFSKYLMSLSRSVPKGLWLSKIELSDAGRQFSLYGKTTHANLVTDFLSALSKETPFSGKVLKIFDIDYNKTEEILEFKIKTGIENPS